MRVTDMNYDVLKLFIELGKTSMKDVLEKEKIDEFQPRIRDQDRIALINFVKAYLIECNVKELPSNEDVSRFVDICERKYVQSLA